MGERLFVIGNEAIGWGALEAGCDAYVGYPITPQNETTEWFAEEFPERGKVFIQSQSEVGSINIVFGAASTGYRVMTSTSGPGWGLMQEGMSHLANAELPCVVSLVQRGGPGAGTTRHGQMDYLSATWGGGNGGYRNIVLTPASVQETYDFTQLAFYLSDKYRNPVILLSDGLLGQMAEPLELKKLQFGALPEKDWAVKGSDNQLDGIRRVVTCMQGLMLAPPYPPYTGFSGLLEALNEKYEKMKETEVRYETYLLEDAELVIVAYGYTARVSKEALKRARQEGLKVGMIRPQTVWPFPYDIVRETALRGSRFLVVEDSLGQLVEDVRFGAQGRTEIHLLGALARHVPTDGGMILPDAVLDEIFRLMK
ncbi:MAG: 3-methyl-2-oxobutanoate dehydrogenase subunit VorB [Thermodesulfobacteriota bacterium]|nr:3-methyl-2-oxobutanoate dehydrogenase subunit VorB [Thermodesulfobacteriota bacterium]